MSIFILGVVEESYGRLTIDISSIFTNYPHVRGQEVDMVCLLLKVFSKDGRVTLDPRSLETLKVIETYNPTLRINEHRVDLTKFASERGIPIGYTVELVALVFLKNTGIKVERIPINPGEVLEVINSGTVYDARRVLTHDENAFVELAASYGIALLLSHDKFKNIADNLLDGLSRYDNSDFGGAVMSFRKTIEAWRNYIIKIDESGYPEKRLEKLKGFTNGTTGILSNFGLHVPANAGPEEARFSRRIVVAFTEYAYKYLNRK